MLSKPVFSSDNTNTISINAWHKIVYSKKELLQDNKLAKINYQSDVAQLKKTSLISKEF